MKLADSSIILPARKIVLSSNDKGVLKTASKFREIKCIKRPNNLAQGELAYSFASGDSGQTLYIGSADSGVSFAIGGAFFTDMLDHTKGVLTPNSAIITDANNKIDKLLVDNTTIDSGDIRTDGNLSLLPSGGNVLVSGNVRTTNQFI